MTSKLEDKKQSFSEKLTHVKQQLNMYKKTGYLPSEYDSDLAELLTMNRDLLEDLLPYFRRQQAQREKISLEFVPIREQGDKQASSFIRQLVQVSDETYCLLYYTGNVQLMVFNVDEQTITWEKKIQTNQEKIRYIIKGQSDTMYLIGYQGTLFELICDSDASFITKKNDYVAKELRDRPLFAQDTTEIICHLDTKQYAVMTIEQLQKVREVPSELDLDFWTGIVKVGDSLYALGDRYGCIYIVDTSHNTIMTKRVVSCFDAEITEIYLLEANQLAVLGKKGNMGVLDVEGSIEKINGLEGNLIELSVGAETCLIISDNGKTYVLEKNLDTWKVNHYATSHHPCLVHVAWIEENSYLAMDVEDDWHVVHVANLLEIDDLVYLNMYS
ncbi:MAG: hypothetical protein ACTJHC_08785 [Vagococcus sp.]